MVSQNVSILIAFAAGLISFVSPCILPVIPSYLSFIGGVSFTEITAETTRRLDVLLRTIFFVAGFSVVFVALGVVFSSAGLLLKGVQTVIDRVAGVLVVLFGVNVLFDFWQMLNVERRFHVDRRPRGVLGSMLLGLAFGAGWTPCVGPILASILFLAGTGDSLARGTLLLGFYSLGLGAPFVLAGFFFNNFVEYSRRLRSHARAIKTASGIFLILLGLLIFVGSLSRLNAALFNLAGTLETWRRGSPAGPRLLFGFLFLGLDATLAVFYAKKSSLRGVVRPFSVVVILGVLAVSIFSFAGVLDVGSVVSAWLRFQGI